YPAPRDGFADQAMLTVLLDKESTLVLHVLDDQGRVIVSERLGLHPRGTVQLIWDGEIGSTLAAPGSYDLQVQAVDLAGNRSPFVDAGLVTIARDTTPPAIQMLRIGRAGRELRVRWSVRDDETPSICLLAIVGNHRVQRCGLPLD